mmetsp:Transcript_2916/g.7203  ORF Transcript_2916/g.7203 Transcript_2916/m.7203 type:complete len:84 (-) Transcript_2916:84-335(-)|eukprot:CAMPEP_0206248050 /NCGR_PEP_ID=MMETSP0047_2-20121206/20149_1 /ASSEMBLY_ACC=CAM_ASM_000192 /TAXON_ID=195065 /ORGANISM="Chroomonas mesostigmatica_cf, Strain CCMP1168" /LENGTH=83 /DNA_ID=CAMNT_0053673641 /DNA_START=132 /DNA_END=383 /DNA_ORIENTATION=-
MPIVFVILPFVLAGGVLGALSFASQETEDMSPAEVTKKLNTEATARLERDLALKKKLDLQDVSREMYREKMNAIAEAEEGVVA